jgi:hypothetical protein
MFISRESAVRIAMSFYAGEPCRICGKTLTMKDIEDGAIYAGYSKNNESRAAHKNCWGKNIPQEKWAYPESAS